MQARFASALAKAALTSILTVTIAASSQTTYDIYRARDGDTAESIADRFNITTDTLIDLNPFLRTRAPVEHELITVPVRRRSADDSPSDASSQAIGDHAEGPAILNGASAGTTEAPPFEDEPTVSGNREVYWDDRHVGRLGIVRRDGLPAYRYADGETSEIYRLREGEPVIVAERVGPWLGVMMIDLSLGWVDAAAVLLMRNKLTSIADTGAQGVQWWAPAWLVHGRVMLPARRFAMWCAGGVHLEGDRLGLYDVTGQRIGEVSTTGRGTIRGQSRSADPKPRRIAGEYCVPVRFLAEAFGGDAYYVAATRTLYFSRYGDSTAWLVRDPAWTGRPSYMQKLVALPEGRGLTVYLAVCDTRGRQIAVDGHLTLKIRCEGMLVYRATGKVRRTDFVRTTVGLGIFAHSEFILPLGRIPFSAMYDVVHGDVGSASAQLLCSTGIVSETTTVLF